MGVDTEYITVKKNASDFFIEKKSRFIGYCCPVETEEAALAFIAERKKENWDASHNVYAYILRNGIMRYSDDGEPQGTAGIPVLDTMKKSGICDAVLVATRYFGGVLLGGGGLVRAYSHTATIAIAAAERVMMKMCLLLSVSCDYSTYGRLNSLIPESGGVIDNIEFLEDVKISFHLAPELKEKLERSLADATNGQVQLEGEETAFYEFALESDE